MKDKLILKDLTEIELETGASLSSLGVLSQNKTFMLTIWDKFTALNLSEVQIKNGTGMTVGNYTDLMLVSETSTVQADNSILTYFNLHEKTDIEKRLDAIEEGQLVQDGAIIDQANVISELAESQGGIGV